MVIHLGKDRREVPIAYMATVIRNRDTFDYFLAVARESKLSVFDQAFIF
jgi:hypothetical protein